MLIALYIFVDDDFQHPLYSEPSREDVDPELWSRVCELTLELNDGERRSEGTEPMGDGFLGWRYVAKNGLTFVCVVDDVEDSDVTTYLKQLVRKYFDEVDDVRNPEVDGVEDVVVDVIPPWD